MAPLSLGSLKRLSYHTRLDVAWCQPRPSHEANCRAGPLLHLIFRGQYHWTLYVLVAGAPRYYTAICGLLGIYCGLVLFQLIYTMWCWVENRRRDQTVSGEESQEDSWEDGFPDLTDKENVHFRYRL